jgi:hypothetical protein
MLSTGGAAATPGANPSLAGRETPRERLDSARSSDKTRSSGQLSWRSL